MSNIEAKKNSCDQVGPAQIAAWIWFGGAVLIGSLLAFNLSKFDRNWFDTKGHVLDYNAYKENRTAFTSIASEQTDARMLSGRIEGAKKH